MVMVMLMSLFGFWSFLENPTHGDWSHRLVGYLASDAALPWDLYRAEGVVLYMPKAFIT